MWVRRLSSTGHDTVTSGGGSPDDCTRDDRRGAVGGVTGLVVVCGVPGVGKTTVAERVAERLDAELFRTDVVRKELDPDPSYTEAETERVYEEIVRRGREAAIDGPGAVLDGTFKERHLRERVDAAVEGVAVDPRYVKVECDERVVRERIDRRQDDESDADYEVHQLFKQTFESLERPHVTVDNSGDLAATRRQVDRHF